MAGDPLKEEITSLIDNHIDGFDTRNNELFISVFGDTPSVLMGSRLIAG